MTDSKDRRMRKRSGCGGWFLVKVCASLMMLMAMVSCTGLAPAQEEKQPTTVVVPSQQPAPISQAENPVLKVEFAKSTYQIASGGTSGFFKSGQEADLLLSGIDFNNTGGPLFLITPQESLVTVRTSFSPTLSITGFSSGTASPTITCLPI